MRDLIETLRFHAEALTQLANRLEAAKSPVPLLVGDGWPSIKTSGNIDLNSMPRSTCWFIQSKLGFEWDHVVDGVSLHMTTKTDLVEGCKVRLSNIGG